MAVNAYSQIPSQVLGPERLAAAKKVIQIFSDRTAASRSMCQGRLTLTSNVPVTTSDVTAATTVYFTPFNGNRVSLMSASGWYNLSFTQISVSVPATTVTPFDVFAYDNSGSLALETADWSSDTARSVSLATVDGVEVKATDKTRLYLGTLRTTTVSGQTEDSDERRFVWNACNRLPRHLLATEPTDSWTYGSTTWRAANGNTTAGQTRVEYVVGLRREPIFLRVWVPIVLEAGPTGLSLGIGINSTTTNSATIYGGHADAVSYNGVNALYSAVPAVGYTFAQWIEKNDSNVAWHSTLNDATHQRAGGLIGSIWQ